MRLHLGDRAFKGVIKVNEVVRMGSDSIWLVSSQEEIGTQMHAEERPCEDPEEGGPPQAKERGLCRQQSCQHLPLGLLAPRTVREYMSVVYGNPRKPIRQGWEFFR